MSTGCTTSEVGRHENFNGIPIGSGVCDSALSEGTLFSGFASKRVSRGACGVNLTGVARSRSGLAGPDLLVGTTLCISNGHVPRSRGTRCVRSVARTGRRGILGMAINEGRNLTRAIARFGVNGTGGDAPRAVAVIKTGNSAVLRRCRERASALTESRTARLGVDKDSGALNGNTIVDGMDGTKTVCAGGKGSGPVGGARLRLCLERSVGHRRVTSNVCEPSTERSIVGGTIVGYLGRTGVPIGSVAMTRRVGFVGSGCWCKF